ncbi:MAG: hypothetical protein RL219_1006, partial [Actinomycetota bacterium]
TDGTSGKDSQRFFRTVVTRDISGDHYTMLQAPHISRLARVLADEVRKTLRG